jgi:hypothetical protein
MTVLVCNVCGATIVARTRFEAEGECPECGAEEGCLVEQDAYDTELREIACENCGFTTDSAVADEITGKRITIDDHCPICEATLIPADRAQVAKDVPEYRMLRAAASKLRRVHTDGIPVDVGAIAAAVGLHVIYDHFDHDGMLIDMTIEVPASEPLVVQRFVIAHEIGHHELRHTGDRRKIEPEANAFASELLMPAAELKEAVTAGLEIRTLANRFQVSRQALVYALMAQKLIASVRTP